MIRYFTLLGLILETVVSLFFLMAGAHQGFGPGANGFLGVVLAILIISGLVWFLYSYKKDWVWCLTGILLISPSVYLYSRLLVQNFHSVAESIELKNSVKLSHFSEELIFWPGSQNPFGIRVNFQIDIPPNNGGQFYGPLIIDAENPVGPGQSFFLYQPGFAGLSPFIRSVQKSISASHTDATYDLYPLQLEDKERNPLDKICVLAKGKDLGLNNLKNLKSIYWIAASGGEIDLSAQLFDLISKNSKLIKAESIKTIYNNLNDEEMFRVGYKLCPLDSQSNLATCYCKNGAK